MSSVRLFTTSFPLHVLDHILCASTTLERDRFSVENEETLPRPEPECDRVCPRVTPSPSRGSGPPPLPQSSSQLRLTRSSSLILLSAPPPAKSPPAHLFHVTNMPALGVRSPSTNSLPSSSQPTLCALGHPVPTIPSTLPCPRPASVQSRVPSESGSGLNCARVLPAAAADDPVRRRERSTASVVTCLFHRAPTRIQIQPQPPLPPSSFSSAFGPSPSHRPPPARPP